MKELDFSNIIKVYAIGDINGNFEDLSFVVSRNIANASAKQKYISQFKSNTKKKAQLNDKFNDCIIISTGNSNLNKSNLSSLMPVLTRLNDTLKSVNSYLLMIRGNDDEPILFNNDSLDLSNIIVVPDYSVIKTCFKNILCIGGGISVNRCWKMNTENFFGKNYWADETVFYNEELLNEIVNNVKIDCVISHSAPLGVNNDKSKALEWVENDETIIDDINKMGTSLEKIYNTISENTSCSIWLYGHYDNGKIYEGENFALKNLRNNFAEYSIYGGEETSFKEDYGIMDAVDLPRPARRPVFGGNVRERLADFFNRNNFNDDDQVAGHYEMPIYEDIVAVNNQEHNLNGVINERR